MEVFEFKPVLLSDLDVLRKYLYQDDSHCSDYSIGIALMWKDFLGLQYAISDEMLILKADINGKERFYMPCGSGDFKAAVDKICDFCARKNKKPKFMSLSEKHVLMFKEYFNVETRENRDYSDYVYEAEKLAHLAGRKYHKKRNHISAFKKKYPQYKFEIINESNIQKVKKFFDEYVEMFPAEDSSEIIERNCALYGLNHLNELGFEGGFLEIDDKVIAFTFGEVKKDILFVHVEKADRNFDGAYAVINNEFARYCWLNHNISWINREDDSGDEGLRKAKLSYYPSHLAMKYGLKIL